MRKLIGKLVGIVVGVLTIYGVLLPGNAAEIPDIRSVQADLVVPQLSDGQPEAGKRVKQSLSNAASTSVYHVLYLPTNFDSKHRFPMIVEFAGNGGYQNRYGDVSDGKPEGSKLGFGISEGKNFIWLCLPFVTEDGRQIARQWWGSPPDFSPASTLAYAKRAIAEVTVHYGVDSEAILLCGFSRGAIACNFIGLNDDEISQLWCGSVVYSHYDGARNWNLPGTDRASAAQRLQRLGNRPQFICHESTENPNRGLANTQTWLAEFDRPERFTFCETGFRNHNDAWTLRPSDAREKLRDWVMSIPSIAATLDHLGGKANVPGN